VDEADEHIPREVVAFIAEHIVSIEQLEILLMLRGQPGRAWTAATISVEAATSERSASTRLADLAARGIANVDRSSADLLYRYAPASTQLQQTIDALATAYARRRYTVIELIFSKPIANLNVYANALRFRKDDSDG
jgi:hypothetical protein